MAACATQEKIGETRRVGNLILPVPDTDFRDFLDELEELARFALESYPSISIPSVDRYKEGLQATLLGSQEGQRLLLRKNE